MSTAMFLFVVAALGALALWWYAGGKRKRSRAARTRDPRLPIGNYRCVEIVFEDDACDQVKRFAGKRLLSGEASDIPVPGCGVAICSCRYVHHKDRRHGDRRNPYPLRAAGPPGSGDRRIKRDRRRPPKKR